MCALCQSYGTNFHAAAAAGDGSGSNSPTISMAPKTTHVAATGNADVDGLLSGFAWNGTVSYSFPNSLNVYPSGYGDGEPTNNFSQVSIYEQDLVNLIMSQVSNFTNLTLSYAGTGTADIRLAHSSSANPTAYAYYPDGTGEGGDIWFGTSYNYTVPRTGDYSTYVHIHEIGHALGLKHSFETGGVANEAVPSAHDCLEYTVMSYRSFANGPMALSNEQFGFPTTFMMDDILALQTLYGADYSSNSGDTVYTWSPVTGQEFINGVPQALPVVNRVFMTVWDGGGTDTYDLSNYTTSVSINLNPGAYSITSTTQLAHLGNGFLADGNVFNAYLYNNDPRSYIDNAIGGAGNDTITGNAADNVLNGGSGNDTLEGGGGHDTLIGGSGSDTFIFSPHDGTDTIGDFEASAGGDHVLLSGIAGVSSFLDVLAHLSQVGSDAVLNFGAGETLTFHNVSASALTSIDFQFQAAAPPTPITDVVLKDGVETAIINDTYAHANIQITDSGVLVTTTGGFNGITNADRLQFSDAIVAFDITGAAGFSFRIYQAAFDRTPDLAGLSWNTHLLDTVLNSAQISAAFVASAEFESTYGANLTNAQFVTALYSNILDRAPDPAGYAGWLNYLNSGSVSRAGVLIGFSESIENHAIVDPKIATGILLDPHYMG